MKEYKIYCLKNPKTLEIRYIGFTSQKYLSTRLAQHFFSANHNYKTHVANWIRKIGEKPVIELIEICNKDNWKEREIYWINQYSNLTNIKEGGNGAYFEKSSESIQRSAKAHEIKIVQLDKNKQLLKIWNSVKEATLYYNGKSLSAISNVLNKRSKTAYSFYWFYYKDYLNNNYEIKQNIFNYSNIKKVYLYDLNNILIKEYKSLNLLSKEFNCAYSNARKALKKQYIFLKKYKIRDYMI